SACSTELVRSKCHSCVGPLRGTYCDLVTSVEKTEVRNAASRCGHAALMNEVRRDSPPYFGLLALLLFLLLLVRHESPDPITDSIGFEPALDCIGDILLVAIFRELPAVLFCEAKTVEGRKCTPIRKSRVVLLQICFS